MIQIGCKYQDAKSNLRSWNLKLNQRWIIDGLIEFLVKLNISPLNLLYIDLNYAIEV